MSRRVICSNRKRQARHGFASQPLDNAGYRQAISVFLDAYPDSRFPLADVIAEGDKVVLRRSLHSTHQAAFQDIPPTGKPVKVSAIATFRVENGKVAKTWLNSDLLGMLQQLGEFQAPEHLRHRKGFKRGRRN